MKGDEMKPDVLNDKEIQNWVEAQDANEVICLELTEIAQRAQRDADYKHEQNTVREIFEQMEGLQIHILISQNNLAALERNWQTLKSKYQETA
jgi:hypothetical protein